MIDSKELLYVLMENAYAKKNNIDIKNDSYDKLKEFFPDDWHLISYEYRALILHESMDKNINIIDTDAYKQRPQEGIFEDKPKSH